MKNFQQKDDF